MKGCLTQHAPTGLGDGREHYKQLITFTLDKQICLIIFHLFHRKIKQLDCKTDRDSEFFYH